MALTESYMLPLETKAPNFSLPNVIDGKFKSLNEVPTNTPLSKKICIDLKKRGFKFIGPTIIYSFMQAVGMTNDHLIDCFCHPIQLIKRANRLPLH